MSSIFFVLALLFAALYFGFFPVRSFLSRNPLSGGHESTLQNVEHRIGILGLFRFAVIPFQRLRHMVTAHRILLFFVCCYTFVFFNPQVGVSSAKQGNTVHCPDGYAYRLANGHYIRCEDFDLYHEDEFKGRIRADLYLDHKGEK